MNPLALALLGYAVLSYLENKEQEDKGRTIEEASFVAPSTLATVDFSRIATKRPPPAVFDLSKKEMPLDVAVAFGYLYVYMGSAGGAKLFQLPLIRKVMISHNFTESDFLQATSEASSVYDAVEKSTQNIPGLSQVIAAGAALFAGIFSFVRAESIREEQIAKLYQIWLEQFAGPLGRPPMALFHGLQSYEKALNNPVNTGLDPSLLAVRGEVKSPALMVHVRLISMFRIFLQAYKMPKEKDVKLAVVGRIKGRNVINYDGLTGAPYDFNLWAGTQGLPYPYFFYAFDPESMFDYCTDTSAYGRYKDIMSKKSKIDACSFDQAEFQRVFPKNQAVFDLEVDSSKFTSSKISIGNFSKIEKIRATRNDWFETRWADA